jgi:hypothetical protein
MAYGGDGGGGDGGGDGGGGGGGGVVWCKSCQGRKADVSNSTNETKFENGDIRI